ncbi:hypothetical protein [Microseira sp. BLCC-F43]|jgi:hypothetical protein|uniref:hypothetical protein n=1 Tax=Microseira sp. BLCC-F43 TaxID=3153602 RepID=UPI0035B8A26E
MTDHKLIFSMDLRDSCSLLWGNLKLIYPDGTDVDYLATSGATGWQGKEDQWTRARGPIPQGFEYRVTTNSYYLATKGVEGQFFHITPDPVRSSGGVTRGEFGVHFDANVPGSAGCIVLRNKLGFEAFCDRMKQIASLGIKSIPLQVVYS